MTRRQTLRKIAAIPVALALSMLGASPASAGIGCPAEERRADAAPAIDPWREKLAAFAPELKIRLWLRVEADSGFDQRADALAPAPAPKPIRRQVDHGLPSGWQVAAQWDLLDITDTLVPGLWDDDERPVSSECLRTNIYDDFDDLAHGGLP